MWLIANNDALSSIVRETAQKGRDLGFLRQMAKQSLDPDVWVIQAKKMLGDKPMTDEMMLSVRKMAKDAADAEAQVKEFINRPMPKPSAANKADEEELEKIGGDSEKLEEFMRKKMDAEMKKAFGK